MTNSFNYSSNCEGLELPIREDIVEVLREAWSRLAKPGNWFTGEQRVAIAAELRQASSCELCKARKEALSPSAVAGEHNHLGALPLRAVEVIHRIVTDQGRITRRWVDELITEGINDNNAQGEYVEIVGVVVMVFSIDEFNRGIGAPLETLPKPENGEPSHYLPPTLESETAFVPMIPADGNTGNEADLWGPMTANVLRAMSLVPNAVRDLMLLSDSMYIPGIMMANPGQETGRAINRMQIELVAGRVSSHNECFY
jgi:hypothetical protein